MVARMYAAIVSHRAWFLWPFKVFIVAGAFFAAYQFRFDFSVPVIHQQTFWQLLPPLLIIKLAVFWRFGLTHGWWRYVSIPDVIELAKANVIASLLVVAWVVFVGPKGVPRSVLMLDGLFCFLFSCGVRFVTRAVRENYLKSPLDRHKSAGRRTLVFGAGQGGQMIAREIRQNPSLGIELVGFVDDDVSKRGQRFQGLPVLGGRQQVGELCRTQAVEEIIIAIPSARGVQLREIVDLCRGTGVTFKTLPGVGELIDGRVTVQQIREIDLEDLLGREPVRLDRRNICSYLEGKRVLVTGAAGSIGSELCRQLAQFRPAQLILYEHAESPLFLLERELAEAFPEVPIVALVGDVRDRLRVDGVFETLLPEVVFHAAAYKHVPMMEANPVEAVNNNVHGTRVIADAAVRCKAAHMVMISTDKAVNPTNVMGATKRAAELYVQGLAAHSTTHFVTVRFGNVLGSAGSVIPIFREQILKGGPVTVTHPEVTRFFMSIPEAALLVLQAGSMGRGGEIFLLDMGDPVKIVDLAREMIQLCGHDLEDIPIVFSGLRPGEKLYEELLIAGEGILPTSHEKIRVARAVAIDGVRISDRVERLYQASRQADVNRVLSLLGELVPEYAPADNGHPQSCRRAVS